MVVCSSQNVDENIIDVKDIGTGSTLRTIKVNEGKKLYAYMGTFNIVKIDDYKIITLTKNTSIKIWDIKTGNFNYNKYIENNNQQ